MFGKVKHPHGHAHGRQSDSGGDMFIPGSPACLSMPSLPGCNAGVVATPGIQPGVGVDVVSAPQTVVLQPFHVRGQCPVGSWPISCDDGGCLCQPTGHGMSGLGAGELDMSSVGIPLAVGAAAYLFTKKPMYALLAAAGAYFLTKK